jgi:hypothetical protein
MSSDPSIWFRVGYALERARSLDASSTDKPRPGKAAKRSPAREPATSGWPTADDLIASGVVVLAGKLLDAWRPARKVTYSRLLRAGAAGAAAALLVDLVRPLLSGRAELPALDRNTGTRLLAGAGQGLLYGAVVEPRVPGPPLVKGAVYALAEYMADPAGGLSRILGPHAPQRRMPIVADLLEDLEPHDREVLDHLVFGIALAVLCGTAPALNGIPQAIHFSNSPTTRATTPPT